jgi:hypothetical protein
LNADTLQLWKVSIPDNQELAQRLCNLRLVDEQSLSPSDDLIEIFSDSPARKHLHIIVRPPLTGECLSFWLSVLIAQRDLNYTHPNLAPESIGHDLTLQFWVFSHTSDRVFPVEIAKTKTVGALKEAIKDERKPDFDHVAADSLVLWKVSSFQRIDGAARRMLAMALKGRHRQA